jgi:uncharacterized protein YggE
MRAALKSAGVDVEKDLKVNDMSNSLKKRNDVTTSRSYQLKLTSAAQLTNVVNKFNGLRISNAQVTRTANSKMAEYRKEVRVEAIKAAKENAQTLAEAIGQSIGAAVWIYDGGNVYESGSNVVMLRTKAYSDSAETATEPDDTPLEFQDITLTYSVQVKFELRP